MDDLMEMFAPSTWPPMSSNMRLMNETPSSSSTATVDNNGVSGCTSQNQNISQIPAASLMWHQFTDYDIQNSNIGTAGLASPPIVSFDVSHAAKATVAEGYQLANGRDGTNINSDQVCFGAVNDQNMFIDSICGPKTQQKLLRPLTIASCGPKQAHISHGVSKLAPTPQGTIAKPTRVRARRGQATDPHSIAERLRRERIAERMKALQELVPIVNKIDKACMLDDVIEYVKFLRLQVKILSMSRMRGTSLVASDLEFPMLEGILNNRGIKSTDGSMFPSPSQNNFGVTESQVAKLMEENMGSAMQFLQRKGLCLMPISLATSLPGNTQTPTSAPWSQAAPSSSSSAASTISRGLPANASFTASMVAKSISDAADEAISMLDRAPSSSYNRESVSVTPKTEDNVGKCIITASYCGQETN